MFSIGPAKVTATGGKEMKGIRSISYLSFQKVSSLLPACHILSLLQSLGFADNLLVFVKVLADIKELK